MGVFTAVALTLLNHVALEQWLVDGLDSGHPYQSGENCATPRVPKFELPAEIGHNLKLSLLGMMGGYSMPRRKGMYVSIFYQ